MNKGELQTAINNLNCNAFIGVCHTVDRGSELSWHLLDDEERMQDIDVLIDDLETHIIANSELLVMKGLRDKGIQEVILLRGW